MPPAIFESRVGGRLLKRQRNTACAQSYRFFVDRRHEVELGLMHEHEAEAPPREKTNVHWFAP